MRNTLAVTGRAGLLWLLFCLLIPVAAAIPVELKEAGVTLTLPDGFKEVPGDTGNPEASRFFSQGTPAGGSSNAVLTIRRLTAGDSTPGREDTRVIGRYSERLNNLDVSVLVAEVVSNDTVTIERSVDVPLDPGTLRLDLRTPSGDDETSRLLMQQIIRSLATQSQQEPTTIQGLRGAIICLVMVAVIFVVALARR